MDNDGAFGAHIADLSKAFDCLHHQLLIAKPQASTYGFDIKSEINSAVPVKQKTKSESR